MDRRDFLKKSTLFAVSVSAFGFVIPGSKNDSFKGDCDTTSDILGPFYRPKAPLRYDLTFEGVQGEVIDIRGTVYGDDCKTPLGNCMVEIWHASADGEYDTTSKDFRYRGRFQTSEDGKYSFRTIVPGRYLNGDTFRPKHYHFRVTAQGHKELVSQIYFKGDPYIDNDPWAGDPKAKLRILDVEKTANEPAVTFNIYMSKEEL